MDCSLVGETGRTSSHICTNSNTHNLSSPEQRELNRFLNKTSQDTYFLSAPESRVFSWCFSENTENTETLLKLKLQSYCISSERSKCLIHQRSAISDLERLSGPTRYIDRKQYFKLSRLLSQPQKRHHGCLAAVLSTRPSRDLVNDEGGKTLLYSKVNPCLWLQNPRYRHAAPVRHHPVRGPQCSGPAASCTWPSVQWASSILYVALSAVGQQASYLASCMTFL